MQCQKLFQANAPINCVCLHPNQAALVVGDQTGALHLWDLVGDTSSKVVCMFADGIFVLFDIVNKCFVAELCPDIMRHI